MLSILRSTSSSCGVFMGLSPIEDHTHLKFMAGIGGVCVQWALLEHLVLGLIATIESSDLDKTYLIFGSLDMKPRLDMALNLARDAKAPVALAKRIEAVRAALRDEGLAEQRNQAVHGVHKASDKPDCMDLTMPRWREPKRTQSVSIFDLHKLSTRLNELSCEIDAIGADFHAWKIRVLTNRAEHAQRELAIANAPILLKIAQSLNASAQRFWRNLKR